MASFRQNFQNMAVNIYYEGQALSRLKAILALLYLGYYYI